jgi:ADP-heptose:LPS heptosyltransferase
VVRLPLLAERAVIVPMRVEREHSSVLVHLAAGIGNIVLATPLLVALNEIGYTVDVCLNADYPATIELLENWSILRAVSVVNRATRLYARVIPAIPPFYWPRFAHLYRRCPRAMSRPADSLFAADEQAYYMAFARALGYGHASAPPCQLPIGPSEEFGIGASTVVLAPGCKTGEMAAKRWPYFPELAERFADVVVVGTADDLPQRPFPPHTRTFVDRLSLRSTAELLASAGLVIGNDSGLSHIAGAVGTASLLLFGPTSELVLGRIPNTSKVLRKGLRCEPCWTASRMKACQGRVDCLRSLPVDTVEACAREMLSSEIKLDQ